TGVCAITSPMSHRRRRRVASLALALAASVPLRAQDPTPRMPWQRNLADALALAASTGKPLLLCVNIDGESACQSLARGRYRDPQFAARADGFVCVVASPDRHDAFDHDDRGRRIPDSKLGRVTSSEHIDIEPALFERWFNDRRVAPRHVGVSPS